MSPIKRLQRLDQTLHKIDSIILFTMINDNSTDWGAYLLSLAPISLAVSTKLYARFTNRIKAQRLQVYVSTVSVCTHKLYARLQKSWILDFSMSMMIIWKTIGPPAIWVEYV